jgi:hypothetical protein
MLGLVRYWDALSMQSFEKLPETVTQRVLLHIIR